MEWAYPPLRPLPNEGRGGNGSGGTDPGVMTESGPGWGRAADRA